MDENEKKTAEALPEQPKPGDYSRYMGTLNRIYRRNNNPQRKKLGDGITSLKKGQQPAASAPMQVDMEECSDSTVTYSVST